MEGIACGEGSGYSKKESQQEAAKVTLQYIRKNTKFADKIFKAKQKRIALEQPEDLSVIETTEDNVSVLPLKDDADDESNTFTNIEREDCFSGMVADKKENIIAKAEAEAFE